MHHFIELHTFGGRSIHINVDSIAVVHASYANPERAVVVVVKGLTGDGLDNCCYEVSEDLDRVMFLIDVVYGRR